MSLVLADFQPTENPKITEITVLKEFEGMTNGEVIQALFPNTPIDTRTYAIWVGHDDMSFTRAWWNAPYKAESEAKDGRN